MPEDIRDALERLQREHAISRRKRTYRVRVCPLCGQTISEGAYSGQAGNFKKHAVACEKARQGEKK